MTWILILYIYTNIGDMHPVSLSNVSGFMSYDDCKQAGETAKDILPDFMHSLRYACVSQKEAKP